MELPPGYREPDIRMHNVSRENGHGFHRDGVQEDTGRREEQHDVELQPIDINECDDRIRVEGEHFEDRNGCNEGEQWNYWEERRKDPVLRAYALFIIEEKLSEKTVARLESMMMLLYDCPPRFNYADVKSLMNRVRGNVIREQLYFCHSCGRPKTKKTHQNPTEPAQLSPPPACPQFPSPPKGPLHHKCQGGAGVPHQLAAPTHQQYPTVPRPPPDAIVSTGIPEYQPAVQWTINALVKHAVHQGKLCEYTAGAIIGRSLLCAPQEETQEEVALFARKYARRVTTRLPTIEQLQSTDYVHNSHLANNLWKQMSEIREQPTIRTIEAMSNSFDVVPAHGAVYVRSQFNFGGMTPFSNEQFDMKWLPQYTAKCTPHLYLKKALVELLQRSCSSPADIQKVSLQDIDEPEDSNNTAHGTFYKFPEGLKENLKQFFLEFFLLEDSKLDDRDYSPEEHDNMRCLKAYKGSRSLKDVFQMYSKAREAFLTCTFRYQLRKALCDVRNAQFLPGSGDGQVADRWKPRTHSRKRQAT
ncbi:unnamed protein product [Caenorhabditis sp. 36 PRJEB53466]|nr:unnamed protein product [Caenorhabditis sp. 36 PRJEB53466]